MSQDLIAVKKIPVVRINFLSQEEVPVKEELVRNRNFLFKE